MITPQQIEHKAQKQFRAFLQAWLADEAFFPLQFPVGKLPMTDYDALAADTKALLDQSKAQRGVGYTVIRKSQRTQYGEQNLPRQIIIESEADYLALTRRKGKFQQFKDAIHLIREQFPELEGWLRQHPFAVLKFADEWPSLLAVCRYFCDHPRPDLYARELPIPIHTKFIERHTAIVRALLNVLLPVEGIHATENHFQRRFGLRYDEPLIRLRFLDQTAQTAHAIPFQDMSVPVSELANWIYQPARCLIVENKLTFLTLPALPNTLAVWGGGFRAELLRHLTWLESCDLFYWGDLDAHGFQILSSLRRHFPKMISLMMDNVTLKAFETYVVEGTVTAVVDLTYLSEAEYQLYQQLQTGNIRLEQEHIPPLYAKTRLLDRMGITSPTDA